MIKKYCDKCGKEITSVVDIDVNKDKPYAYEEHFELCEDCYKRLKAKDVTNNVYMILHHSRLDNKDYAEKIFAKQKDADEYIRTLGELRNSQIGTYVSKDGMDLYWLYDYNVY